jgi:GTPase SAR1 family protein
MLEKDLLTDEQLGKLIKFLKKIKYSKINLADDLIESTLDIFPEKESYQKSLLLLEEIINQIAQQYDINWIISYLSSHIHEQFEKTISQGQVQAILKRELGITLTSTERSQLHELRKKGQRYERFLDSFGEWGKVYDQRFKIILLGLDEEYSDEILYPLNKMKYLLNKNNESSIEIIGVDFHSYILEVFKISVLLQIWNISDNKRFEFIRQQYFLGSAGIILVINREKRESFEKIKNFISEIEEKTKLVFNTIKLKNKFIRLPIALVVIGDSKILPNEEINSLVEEIGAKCFDIPKINGYQIPEILRYLTQEILTRSKV